MHAHTICSQKGKTKKQSKGRNISEKEASLKRREQSSKDPLAGRSFLKFANVIVEPKQIACDILTVFTCCVLRLPGPCVLLLTSELLVSEALGPFLFISYPLPIGREAKQEKLNQQGVQVCQPRSRSQSSSLWCWEKSSLVLKLLCMQLARCGVCQIWPQDPKIRSPSLWFRGHTRPLWPQAPLLKTTLEPYLRIKPLEQPWRPSLDELGLGFSAWGSVLDSYSNWRPVTFVWNKTGVGGGFQNCWYSLLGNNPVSLFQFPMYTGLILPGNDHL